jgi:ActR/RegA family two-component response regulator
MGTVLVVDDDAGLRKILATALGMHGLEVRTATNSKSALDVISQERPDDVLVDLALTDTLGIDRSGLGVIDNVRLWDPTLHVALNTSYLTKEVEEQVWSMQTVDILEKPTPIAKVLAWIEEKNKQPEVISGRWEGVSPRRVLYLSASVQRPRFSKVSLKIVTTVEEAYQQLRNDYEIVLIAGDHDHLVPLTIIASEQGLCVYVLTANAAHAQSAREAGAAGSIAPRDLQTLATVPLVTPEMPVPIALSACASVDQMVTQSMSLKEKLKAIDRILLEEARSRHASVRTSAVASGIPRTTMTRHLTPTGTKVAPTLPTEVSPWVCRRIQEIITTPMRHRKKLESIGRLLVQDALVRHDNVTAATAALGISRWTLMRHLDPQPHTFSDSES